MNQFAGCKFLIRAGAVGAMLVGLSGCANYPGWLSSSGPSRDDLLEQRSVTPSIPVVNLDNGVANRLKDLEKHNRFGESFGEGRVTGHLVGSGDYLEISVWEAPPATLFGAAVVDPGAGIATTRQTTLPEQMVSVEGVINMPFAGPVKVSGKSVQQIEAEIASRLKGKANQPQVIVRVTRNATANVTVVGEVNQSARLPLSAKGERLLDALAAAGGVRQPVGKVTLQLSRAGKVQSMPLDEIIRDPAQNILLQPGDVITALFQPNSFTSLGASNRNEEVNFEASGISLAQALGRVGGLQDQRADAMGVFIFRFEDPAAFASDGKPLPKTNDGKVPVVYRVDLMNPGSFLVAQSFPMRNKDVVYVANAPAAELQKFLNILTSSIFSVSSLVNLGN